MVVRDGGWFILVRRRERFVGLSILLQEKPSSFVVRNGGWVIYSSPNWKGKAMYIFDGKHSNI